MLYNFGELEYFNKEGIDFYFDSAKAVLHVFDHYSTHTYTKYIPFIFKNKQIIFRDMQIYLEAGSCVYFNVYDL